MGKRIILFLLVNILVVAMMSIIFSIFGISPYLNQHGIDYKSLAIFCLIWGMGGSFISLFISKWMAKHGMGVHIIDPSSARGNERTLLDIVYRLADRAGLPAKPEVGIYQSPDANAFATGPSKRSALVAVSSGLLQRMNQQELEGVLGHEISHIANGDMVTMTLLQGILNSFAMFLSRIVAWVIASAMSSNDRDGDSFSYLTFYLLSFVFDIVFTLLASIVTAAYSRWREYRADQGGANLAGKSNMIAALEKLKSTVDIEREDKRAPSLATMRISHHGRMFQLFSSHPPLDRRIKRLQEHP